MASSTGRKTAGLTDLRLIIGGLLTVYGVILISLGLFRTSDEELARGDGFNINLWAGVGMLVVGLGFAAWTRWRPLVVPPDAAASDGPA